MYSSAKTIKTNFYTCVVLYEYVNHLGGGHARLHVTRACIRLQVVVMIYKRLFCPFEIGFRYNILTKFRVCLFHLSRRTNDTHARTHVREVFIVAMENQCAAIAAAKYTYIMRLLSVQIFVVRNNLSSLDRQHTITNRLFVDCLPRELERTYLSVDHCTASRRLNPNFES